jgi:alkylation response protein AidB-like acyl-CoA dehydrogenase
MVGPGSSIDKLLVAKTERDINDLILDVRRDWMMTGSGPADAKELNATRAKWWYTRAATIMGGSAEVQRGIIADHLLGLPKEKR